MSDYLSPDELRDLTDSPMAGRQIGWLRLHGWKFAVGLGGRPKVLRSYRDKRLGVAETTAPERIEPDWDKVA